jgi:hypothetical protein
LVCMRRYASTLRLRTFSGVAVSRRSILLVQVASVGLYALCATAWLAFARIPVKTTQTAPGTKKDTTTMQSSICNKLAVRSGIPPGMNLDGRSCRHPYSTWRGRSVPRPPFPPQYRPAAGEVPVGVSRRPFHVPASARPGRHQLACRVGYPLRGHLA